MTKKLVEKRSKQKSRLKPIVVFPARILEPVKAFLSREEEKLRRRKKELGKEDPFSDVRRVSDNAAPDLDAAEQTGHERVSALQQEIDRKLIQIRKALTRIKIGRYGLCEKCGQMIDTDRLMVMPEATFCVECEKKKRE